MSEPQLPPRPPPPRRWGDVLRNWIEWVGVARLVLAAVSVVVVVGGVAWLVRAAPSPAELDLPVAGSTPPSVTLVPPTTIQAAATPEPAVSGIVVVHVAGSVSVPGVYELRPGDRIVDAVAAAGGATPDADLDGLNLAASIADGERVYVPAHGEVDPASVPTGAPASADGPPAASGPIDLNVATAEQLEMLPGVGPATAAAIVDDRDRNGPFATVDDLDRVPGIGPAKLEAIREQVTV